MKPTMKKAELVILPMPAMGHLVPTMELARLLLALNPNLSITVLVIKPSYDSGAVTAYLDSLAASANNTSSTAGRLKLINLPQDEAPKDVPPFKMISMFAQTLGPHVKAAVADIVHHSNAAPDSPRLAGIVLDMFLAPLADSGDEFGVPSYVFFTSGAAFLGFQLFTQALHDEQHVDLTKFKGGGAELTLTMPCYVNPVPAKCIPAIMLHSEAADVINGLIRALRKAKGILVNTFSELESHAIASLSSCGGTGTHPHVYPVGPILNLTPTSADHDSDDIVIKWLDEQPHSSVVFLCFGSMGSFGEDQVREIAYALERSGHRFLWSLRQPPKKSTPNEISPNEYETETVERVLPQGFLDRTAGIGKIIGWAPQVAILGHRAIGGFVSHCGWNSTLESLWFGVPIAAWPIYAEQQLNAFQLVKELGLAVEIKLDYVNDPLFTKAEDVVIVSADTIERGIRCLMEQDSDVRKRVKEMSEKSRKALMEGGSSHSTLCRFINNVTDKL